MPTDIYKPEIEDLLVESSIIAAVDPPLKTIENIAFLTSEYGKTFFWDTGVRSILGVEKLDNILKYVDYLFVNQVEVENLTGQSQPPKAWERLAKINEAIKLVLKLGEKGCLLVSKKDLVEVAAIDLREIGLQVVNTVGCGDAFLGAFSASKAQGLSDKAALERANLAGALKATKPETRGSPAKTELERYLKFIKPANTVERN